MKSLLSILALFAIIPLPAMLRTTISPMNSPRKNSYFFFKITNPELIQSLTACKKQLGLQKIPSEQKKSLFTIIKKRSSSLMDISNRTKFNYLPKNIQTTNIQQSPSIDPYEPDSILDDL